MNIVAIVPAWNEEETIFDVVRTLVSSREFVDVLVMDDGSTDRTGKLAYDAGGTVFLRDHQGKSEAMLGGINAANAVSDNIDAYAFFDADLIGLRIDHCTRLCAPVSSGVFEMSCGRRDYGPIGNLVQHFGPLITGERVIHRRVIEALPRHLMTGYSAEMVINATCESLCADVCVQLLDGLTIRRKEHKQGLWRGIRGYVSMSRQIVRAKTACSLHFNSDWPEML